MVTRSVEAWGRLSHAPHRWLALDDRAQVAAAIAGAQGLVHGNGRSYGDVALNPQGALWGARGLDRFIAFDAAQGVLDCEAGVTLQEVTEVALPRGWFLPVTPGTQFATVGGAVANDVHGKNHHRCGSFGEHVRGLRLQRTDGRQIDCGPTQQADWFRATVGGLGLTGVITQATLQLRRVPGPWIESDSQLFHSVAEFVALSEASVAEWEYTVAWIDCLATRGDRLRGVLFRGNHVADDRPLPRRAARRFPFTSPLSLVNTASLRAFNALHWQRQRWAAGRRVRQPYTQFFYPLDGLLGWNRMYGPCGFYQYQCVLPPPGQEAATAELLGLIAKSGTGSFLGVLKTFGERPSRGSAGLLSFPMPGITLALDFPNQGPRTMRLFEQLNDVVRRAGGRLYPAKDACMPRELFERGYPALAEFRRFRDPGLSSQMSRRLLGD